MLTPVEDPALDKAGNTRNCPLLRECGTSGLLNQHVR